MAAEFRYFAQPHAFSTYRSEPAQCALCANIRAGYSDPRYAPNDEFVVCEECLVAGRLKAAGIETNMADQRALEQQLRALHPDWLAADVKDALDKRTAELVFRTPPITTWQYLLWPAHCGDYCRYVKEVGQPEVDQRAPDGNGVAFFAEHSEDVQDISHALEIWLGIRPDAPINNALTYGVGVYAFECLHCHRPVLQWDCD